MSKNISYFVLGFALTVAIVFGLGWYLTKADSIESADTGSQAETLSREDFNKSASDTNALNKNGDIPISVTADQIGRENPFDSY